MDNRYQSGNLVLLKIEQNTEFGTDAYQGPWEIKSVNQNGMVKINKGIVSYIVIIKEYSSLPLLQRLMS